MDRKNVVVSGMRPTGKLHLGNYWGALRRWVELSRSHECYFFVADWHMLTTGYEETASLGENVREMVLDWLGTGLDPERCVIFRQSDVPEHAELALLLGMVTPLSWLENNPTWKEQLQELSRTKHSRMAERSEGALLVSEKTAVETMDSGLRTFGFLGYPVLQAADILLYHGTDVPVGQDQLPHLELTREIARRFNSIYGEVLTEPRSLLTSTPKLPGTDGRKMSKSYGNTLELNESPETLKSKVMNLYTDPTKARADTPGHPEPCPENPPGCVVYALHKLYTPGWEKIGSECRAGALGCVADKRDRLLPGLEKSFSEFRAARARYAGNPSRVQDILDAGAKKARAVAGETLSQVRRAMGVS